jgi:uncharacterized protein (DUF58 family)
MPVWMFLLKLLIVAAPLAALGYFRRVFPHWPLMILALVPAVLSVVLIAAPEATDSILAVDALLAAVALVDLFSLPSGRAFAVEREVGRSASLSKDHPVTLMAVNQSARPHFIWLRDDVPPELRAEPEDFRLTLEPMSRTPLKYRLNSVRRGAFTLPKVHLRVRSRWGFWQRFFQYPLASVVHVYPDMKQLSEYSLLARKNRLNLLGVRRTRKIGQDNEFERLRDYTLDDNYKHIDWRSTARRQKLTVRDFQANQSQRVIFLIDCGRMMTNEAAGLSLLDHAFNAMLMLSYVALSRGDSVGLICFSDEIHHFIPPASGLKQMNRLLHACFDRFPRLVESRYDQAFLYLAAHCRKRSLVILVSSLIDEVNANQIERYLSTFVGKHLALGVLLRDRPLFDAVELINPQDGALYRAAAAADILAWRRQVLSDLEAKGVLSLDCFPEELTAPLVNRYLEIKARHLL